MGKKVLLAEDSLTIQKVFELTFRGSDVALTMVDNGDDAVRLAGEIAPDLVVADVNLAGKNGFEVAASLCAPDRTRAVPVLILSGTLVPFDEEKFKKSGASGVIFKPFESQELVDKVTAILKGGEPPARAAAEEPKAAKPAAAEETWDFTDVIAEVENETANAQSRAAAAAAQPSRGADIFAGMPAPEAKGEGAVSLDDFDVSLEDLEVPSKDLKAAPAAPLSDVVDSFDEAVETGAPPVEAAATKPPPHITGDLFGDAPPAVTDLTAALDSVEELEDLDIKDEMALLEKEVAERARTAAPQAKPAAASFPPAPPVRQAAAQLLEAAPPVPQAAAAPVAAPAAAPVAPPAEGPKFAAPASRVEPGQPAHDEFSARAREIIGKVAAEAAEKVMWEMMDRLSEDLSVRIREAVESVAWEVIPPTAETLIREEIARLRGQAEKKSP